MRSRSRGQPSSPARAGGSPVDGPRPGPAPGPADHARDVGPTAPLSDGQLAADLAARRPGAFEAVVAVYQDRLYGLAWRLLGNREDAQEATQDALVRAHRALFQQYSASRVRELALRPWLFAILANCARNRRRGRRPAESLDAPGLAERPRRELRSAEPDPSARAEGQELAALLEQELIALPVHFRGAVVLRMVEGLSYEQVAQVLGRPLGTVKSDVHRGLRRLRERLGPLLEAS